MGVKRRGPISKCRRPKSLPGFELWKGLKTIGVVTSLCVRDGKETDRGPLLHQQPGDGREATRARRPGPLGHRESCHWVST